MTLTKGQRHPMSHHFEGLYTGYLFAKSHNFSVHNVWDIVKYDQQEGQSPYGSRVSDELKFYMKIMILSKIKVTQCHIILKISPQSNFHIATVDPLF